MQGDLERGGWGGVGGVGGSESAAFCNNEKDIYTSNQLKVFVLSLYKTTENRDFSRKIQQKHNIIGAK